MNNELDFENNKPQVSFESTINNLEFQAPQNVVGGATNYIALSNKPKINGVELVGNKTLEDLGIKQEYTANDITFEDGTTFQEKYNSGELNGADGKDGYTPIKNKDYFDGKNGVDGKNGYTPVKGIDYFDGKDGKDGADGKTPVKGTDYYTEEDKQEIVRLVLNSLPSGEGVSY